MRRRVLLAALGAALAGPVEAQIFAGDWDGNQACIDLKINYRICGACPFCWPCADIAYWLPKWEVDASRDRDSRGRPSRGDGELHFYQVKVKPMTKGIFQQPCNESRSCVGGCFRPTVGAIVDHFYDSRRDEDWLLSNNRMTRERVMPPWVDFLRIAPPTGTWGRAQPRAGHIIHTSKLAASGLASLRGFNIARYPYDLWPESGHYRLDSCQLPSCGPLVPNAQFPEVGPFPCMQLEEPARLGCAAAGFDFSNALRSVAPDYEKDEDGKYTWIIWKHRKCTCPVPLGYCAEQLRDLGDDNRCVAPGSLGSVVRQVGETVIGELRSTIGALADTLREELNASAESITQGFTRVTQSTEGQGPAPVRTPTTCSRPEYESCQRYNARVRAHNAALGADERHLRRPLRDCGRHRSSCCENVPYC